MHALSTEWPADWRNHPAPVKVTVTPAPREKTFDDLIALNQGTIPMNQPPVRAE